MCWALSNPLIQSQHLGHSLALGTPAAIPAAMVPRSSQLDQGATRTGHKTTGARSKPRYQVAHV